MKYTANGGLIKNRKHIATILCEKHVTVNIKFITPTFFLNYVNKDLWDLLHELYLECFLVRGRSQYYCQHFPNSTESTNS